MEKQVVAGLWSCGQEVKTPPFHGGNPGSIPGRITKLKKERLCLFFLIDVNYLRWLGCSGSLAPFLKYTYNLKFSFFWLEFF